MGGDGDSNGNVESADVRMASSEKVKCVLGIQKNRRKRYFCAHPVLRDRDSLTVRRQHVCFQLDGDMDTVLKAVDFGMSIAVCSFS